MSHRRPLLRPRRPRPPSQLPNQNPERSQRRNHPKNHLPRLKVQPRHHPLPMVGIHLKNQHLRQRRKREGRPLLTMMVFWSVNHLTHLPRAITHSSHQPVIWSLEAETSSAVIIQLALPPLTITDPLLMKVRASHASPKLKRLLMVKEKPQRSARAVVRPDDHDVHLLCSDKMGKREKRGFKTMLYMNLEIIREINVVDSLRPWNIRGGRENNQWRGFPLLGCVFGCMG
mmetsp:Transcript_22087/g.46054  ORF Transcript_22087/g.46054 Transcript_22087/m.46054 type:complete len:229 (+) Transcript_22087:992-1678(+)